MFLPHVAKNYLIAGDKFFFKLEMPSLRISFFCCGVENTQKIKQSCLLQNVFKYCEFPLANVFERNQQSTVGELKFARLCCMYYFMNWWTPKQNHCKSEYWANIHQVLQTLNIVVKVKASTLDFSIFNQVPDLFLTEKVFCFD